MEAQTPTDLVPIALQRCVCVDNKNPCDLCCGELCFLDQGIRVKLSIRSGEDAIGLALDGCVFTDNEKRCDGLFILKKTHKVFIILVELKATNIEAAYEQIAHVHKHRQQYADLVTHLTGLHNSPRQIMKRDFIITKSAINSKEKQDYDKYFGIKPQIITLGKSCSTPDIRDVLR